MLYANLNIIPVKFYFSKINERPFCPNKGCGSFECAFRANAVNKRLLKIWLKYYG
jgi:hypothetical protein